MSAGILPALVLLGGWAQPHLAHACAPAPPEGHEVSIDAEEALIVWNESEGVQDFVRRASFSTSAASFGFLVPTPTQPELSELDDDLFDRLLEVTEPTVEYRTRTEPHVFVCTPMQLLMLSGGTDQGETAGAPPVELLHSQRVAGYDAVVLRARNAEALNAWLARNGYQSSQSLRDWLEPYVEQGWVITAFKIAKDEADQVGVATSAVRMSFEAERPFFPYREPDPVAGVEDDTAVPSSGQGPPLLRVFLVASEPLRGTLGSGVDWPGELEYANQDEDLTGQLSQILQGTGLQLGQRPWLMRFDDRSSPRPATSDLFFRPAETQAALLPEPIVVTHTNRFPLPLDLIALLVVAGWLVVRRFRSREPSSGATS